MTIKHFPAPPGIKAPPLSFAARSGDLLFISGIPGFDAQGNLPEKFEAQFANVVVAERNGRLIRLGQVATIIDGIEDQRTLALYTDSLGRTKEAVGIDIKKSKGYSTTDVADQILARVEQIRKTLPAGTTIDVIKNKGVNVRNSVNNVRSVSLPWVALATPKSITLGTGAPSWTVTSTFEGLRSR